MRNKPFKLFVLSWAGWGFAQSVAGAYFGVYALQILKFSFFQLQLFNSFAALCQFAAAPVAGYLIDKYGNRPIYTLSYLVITTVPLLWVFTRVDMPVLTFSILFVAQILSGVCGGAMGLAQFNMLLGLSPSDQMPRYSAVLSTIAGAAGVVGPLIGGAIAQATKDVVIPAGGWDIGAYKITFLVSTVLRWMLIPLVLRLSEPKSQEPMDVLGSLARSRPHRSLRHLRRLRGPARPEERASSAQALGRMKERLALEELVEALEDPVLSVRRQATIALGRTGRPPRAGTPGQGLARTGCRTAYSGRGRAGKTGPCAGRRPHSRGTERGRRAGSRVHPGRRTDVGPPARAGSGRPTAGDRRRNGQPFAGRRHPVSGNPGRGKRSGTVVRNAAIR